MKNNIGDVNMDKLKLINVKTIMNKYNMQNRKEVDLHLNLDKFYLSVIPDDSLEIACDYILQNLEDANESNYDSFFEESHDTWWIFAVTGLGDSWAMRIDNNNEVAFIDHEQESKAKPYSLSINFKQWLQLADLNRQFEELNGYGTPLYKEFIKKLDSISKGLSKIYPYSVD